MDDDPSQQSKPAKTALDDTEAELLELPPCCGDVHCIENAFKFFKGYLDDEAIEQNITKESFDQFTTQVLGAFNNISIDYIDKLISSMAHSIEAVLPLVVTEQYISVRLQHCTVCVGLSKLMSVRFELNVEEKF